MKLHALLCVGLFILVSAEAGLLDDLKNVFKKENTTTSKPTTSKPTTAKPTTPSSSKVTTTESKKGIFSSIGDTLENGFNKLKTSLGFSGDKSASTATTKKPEATGKSDGSKSFDNDLMAQVLNDSRVQEFLGGLKGLAPQKVNETVSSVVATLGSKSDDIKKAFEKYGNKSGALFDGASIDKFLNDIKTNKSRVSEIVQSITSVIGGQPTSNTASGTKTGPAQQVDLSHLGWNTTNFNQDGGKLLDILKMVNVTGIFSSDALKPALDFFGGVWNKTTGSTKN